MVSAGGRKMRIIISALLVLASFQAAAEIPGCEKCVDTPNIAPKAVTTGKIAPNAVTRSKLAPESVGASEIIDGSITAEKLAPSLAGSSSMSLVLTDSDGQEFPVILLGAAAGLDPYAYNVNSWDGLINTQGDVFVRLNFNRDEAWARTSARLYYSGANCSGDTYLETELPYGIGLMPYPMFSPKTFVVGGAPFEAPLEVYAMGRTLRDTMQVQSFRDIGKWPTSLDPRTQYPMPDPYERPLTEGFPTFIKDVCITELQAVKNLRELSFLSELVLAPPLSLKMD